MQITGSTGSKLLAFFCWQGVLPGKLAAKLQFRAKYIIRREGCGEELAKLHLLACSIV